MIEPLRLTFDVPCPPDLAFEVWTGRIDGVPRGTSRDGPDLYVGTLRGTFLAYRGELP